MDYLLQRLLKTFAFTAPSASPILVLAILGQRPVTFLDVFPAFQKNVAWTG